MGFAIMNHLDKSIQHYLNHMFHMTTDNSSTYKMGFCNIHQHQPSGHTLQNNGYFCNPVYSNYSSYDMTLPSILGSSDILLDLSIYHTEYHWNACCNNELKIEINKQIIASKSSIAHSYCNSLSLTPSHEKKCVCVLHVVLFTDVCYLIVFLLLLSWHCQFLFSQFECAFGIFHPFKIKY